jgi:hypothetical protein
VPIPEPGRYRPSNLTKQQRQQELAAAYGVPMPQQLSESDYEHMRILLAQHESERKPVTIVDLNNPPRAAYRHQKFPMMVYDLEHSTREKVVTGLVHSEKELMQALEDGWSENAPEYREERVEPLKATLQAEADQIDEQLHKRGPGRPRRESAA